MLTYSIRKSSKSDASNEKPTKVTQGESIVRQIIDAAQDLDREESFERHLRRCYFNLGDIVRFKRPKRGAPKGVVDYIERDINKVFWDGSGTTPRYIRLALENNTYVWVCENRINFVASGKKK